MDRMLEVFLNKQHETAREMSARGDLLEISWPSPQHAVVELRCIGLVRAPDGRIVEHDYFAYGVHFADHHLRWVQQESFATLLSPLTFWHTNARAIPGVPAGVVCLGHVAPGTEIDDVVYRLFDLTTYENYAPQENDCLNRSASAWARAHTADFPDGHASPLLVGRRPDPRAPRRSELGDVLMRELVDGSWWCCEAEAPSWLARLPLRHQVAAAASFEAGVALVATCDGLALRAERSVAPYGAIALPPDAVDGQREMSPEERGLATLRERLARAAAPNALRAAPLSGNAALPADPDAVAALADVAALLGVDPFARSAELEPTLRGFTLFARDDGSFQVDLGARSNANDDGRGLPFATLGATADGGCAATVALAAIGERDCVPECADAAALVALRAAATARGVGARTTSGGTVLVLHTELDAPLEPAPVALALCALELAALACAREAALFASDGGARAPLPGAARPEPVPRPRSHGGPGCGGVERRMTMNHTATMDVFARGPSGAARVKASGVPTGSTVAEFVRSMLGRMKLVDRDPDGRPLTYRARLAREGRLLNPNERVGDALEPDDEVVIAARVEAGSGH